VIANVNDATVSIFHGNGHGSFPIREDLRAGAGPAAVAVATSTGDGFADVVAVKSHSRDVSAALRVAGRVAG